MRKDKPQLIADVLKGVVQNLSQAKKKDANLASAWASCAGRQLKRHTRPTSLKKGTVWVNVDESAWLYQASLQKAKLLEALQKKIGKAKIKQIQFRIGKI